MWRGGFPLQEARGVFEGTVEAEGTTGQSVQGGDSGVIFMAGTGRGPRQSSRLYSWVLLQR